MDRDSRALRHQKQTVTKTTDGIPVVRDMRNGHPVWANTPEGLVEYVKVGGQLYKRVMDSVNNSEKIITAERNVKVKADGNFLLNIKGYIGMGVTAPEEALHIETDRRAVIKLVGTSTDDCGYDIWQREPATGTETKRFSLFFDDSDNKMRMFTFQNSNSDLVIGTGWDAGGNKYEAMYFDHDRQCVGIGDSIIAAGATEEHVKLHVKHDNATKPVVRFTNANTGNNGDVMILENLYTSHATTSNNYIDFRDGNTGKINAIQGDGSGGIEWESSDVTYSSDSRIKENIATLSTSGLDKINALRPVTFDYSSDWLNNAFRESKTPNHESGTQIGFIAQEINAVIPELRKPGYRRVYKDNITYDGNAVDKDTFVEVDQVIYGRPAFNAYLVKAIQELSAKVTTLETKVAALESGD